MSLYYLLWPHKGFFLILCITHVGNYCTCIDFTIASTIKSPQLWVRFVALNSRRKHLNAAENIVFKRHVGVKLPTPMRSFPAFNTKFQTFLSWSSIQGVCASPSLWKFPVSQSPESLTRSFAGWVRTQTPELSLSSPMRTTSGECRGMLMTSDNRTFMNHFSPRLIFPSYYRSVRQLSLFI